MSKKQQRPSEIAPRNRNGQNRRAQQSNAFLMGFLAGLKPQDGRLGMGQSPDAWTKNLVDQMIRSYSNSSNNQPPSMSAPQGPATSPQTAGPNVSQPNGHQGGANAQPSNAMPQVSSPSVSTPEPGDVSVNTQNVTPPSVSTPTSSGPTLSTPGVTGGNRPPEITSAWTRNTQPMFDETVDVYFNASDPDWDPLSWNYDISGAHTESVVEPGPTPWIKVSIDLLELDLQAGDTFKVSATVSDPAGASDTDSLDFEVFGREMAVWEVLFDTQSVHDLEHPDHEPQRIDPLIFDLNLDGQLDITGSNQEGNGELDGETVLFDMDPTSQGTTGWEFSSPGHRPGYYEGGTNSRAPGVPNGTAIYDTGEQESTNKHGIGSWFEDRSKGDSADIFDEEGNLVGQWREDTWGESHQGRIGQYYWGMTGSGEHRERTEWIQGTGDGFLVWDHNGNGVIDDNTEMMSEFDVEGNKTFENGFDKLAHYFDKDGDGIISGSELDGLMFWVDDGDAITEDGELQTLEKYGITHITIPTEGLTSTSTVGKAGTE